MIAPSISSCPSSAKIAGNREAHISLGTYPCIRTFRMTTWYRFLTPGAGSASSLKYCDICPQTAIRAPSLRCMSAASSTSPPTLSK